MCAPDDGDGSHVIWILWDVTTVAWALVGTEMPITSLHDNQSSIKMSNVWNINTLIKYYKI